jgi:hypothetical protein
MCAVCAPQVGWLMKQLQQQFKYRAILCVAVFVYSAAIKKKAQQLLALRWHKYTCTFFIFSIYLFVMSCGWFFDAPREFF